MPGKAAGPANAKVCKGDLCPSTRPRQRHPEGQHEQCPPRCFLRLHTGHRQQPANRPKLASSSSTRCSSWRRGGPQTLSKRERHQGWVLLLFVALSIIEPCARHLCRTYWILALSLPSGPGFCGCSSPIAGVAFAKANREPSGHLCPQSPSPCPPWGVCYT